MSISKLEHEVTRLTKIRDRLDTVFGVVYVALIVVAAIVCPIMIRF